MEEDMQAICDLLLRALQATRGGRKLVRLDYAVEPGRETVTAVFQSGGTRKIDVTGDSGTAMIYDIMKHI
ncbi:MAG: hypothetical protein IIY61_00195 [Ruminococcus sp.]|nr:hypothetical protein [Ruminococcus sp.]